MAIDWIGRNIYLVGPEPSFLAKGDSIWKYNLDTKKPLDLIYSVSGGVKILNMAHDPIQK